MAKKKTDCNLRSWDSYSKRDQVMMVREVKNRLQATIVDLNQNPLYAVGVIIEEQNPELAAIFKEAADFGDRIALQLSELDSKR